MKPKTYVKKKKKLENQMRSQILWKKFLSLTNKINNEKDKGKDKEKNQMLSRLPITLAQLKAENNSEKPVNEIRQLLYSLHRSKKLNKTIYNHLINAI